jgi:hypothetical protein
MAAHTAAANAHLRTMAAFTLDTHAAVARAVPVILKGLRQRLSCKHLLAGLRRGKRNSLNLPGWASDAGAHPVLF